MALPKTPTFYKLIEKAISSFGERYHLTSRQHFAPLLGYRGDNAAIQLSTALNYTTYNTASPKPISVDQLYILLHELGEDRNIILDGLAKEFNLTLIKNEEVKPTCKDINISVDILCMESADVFKAVKLSLADGVVDADEKAEIQMEIDQVVKAALELQNKLKEM